MCLCASLPATIAAKIRAAPQRDGMAASQPVSLPVCQHGRAESARNLRCEGTRGRLVRALSVPAHDGEDMPQR